MAKHFEGPKTSVRTSTWFGTIIIALILIVGLALLILSENLPRHATEQKIEGTDKIIQFQEKSRLAEITQLLGEVLLIVGGLHGVFELFLKPKLFAETAERTLSTIKDGLIEEFKTKALKDELFEDFVSRSIKPEHVANCGIVDFVDDSKKVQYEEMVLTSNALIVGVMHSPRLLRDNFEAFSLRAQAGKSTTLLILDKASYGWTYETEHFEYASLIGPNLDTVEAEVKNINASCPNAIEIRRHSVVLRYSFVFSENEIWIKFYRSSKGNGRIPAFLVKKDSPLYAFYKKDIESIVKDSHR